MQSSNGDTDMANSLTDRDTGEEGEGGMDGESSMETCIPDVN